MYNPSSFSEFATGSVTPDLSGQLSLGGTLLDQRVSLFPTTSHNLRRAYNEFVEGTQDVVSRCNDANVEEIYKICNRVLAGLRKQFNKFKKNTSPPSGDWEFEAARLRMESLRDQFISTLASAKKELNDTGVAEEEQKMFLSQLSEAFAPARITVRNIKNRIQSKNEKSEKSGKGGSQ